MTVRDNGIGVDPDQASRIFDMFSRAATPTRRGRDRAGGVPAGHRGARRPHLGRAAPTAAAASSASRFRTDGREPIRRCWLRSDRRMAVVGRGRLDGGALVDLLGNPALAAQQER